MESISMDESMIDIVVSHVNSIPPPEIGTWKAYLIETTQVNDVTVEPLNIGHCNQR